MLALLLSCATTPDEAPAAPLSVATLSAGQLHHGFTVDAVYLDDEEQALGARLTHGHTGFVLDLLRLETAPQAYLWVESPGASDRGEPHTQEHLLLGKGNVGRAVANQEALSLVGSSAFTAQLHTAYHLNTTAGPAAFADILHARLDALLHPDYTDEEIRREVHHFGPKEEADGSLWLEEKGTVYNEMVSSFSGPWGRLWHGLGGLIYGADHPAAVSQGGEPAAIRTMTPEHIRDFHATWYQLDRMGMIGVWPRSVELEELLGGLDASLVALQPEPSSRGPSPELPSPATSDDKAPRAYAYPASDPAAPTGVLVAWPPRERDAVPAERLLHDAVLDTLSADNGELYGRFVHPETRTRDEGLTEVYAFTRDPLEVVMVGLDGVTADKLDEQVVDELRDEVVDVFRTVTDVTGAEQADFRRRLDATLVSHARSARERIASPPRFGVRGTGTAWYEHLELLAKSAGTTRLLSFRDTYGQLRDEVAAGAPWATFTGHLADTEPFVAWRKPSPERIEALAADRDARLAAEVARLAEAHGGDEQAALAAFQTAYDADSEELEALAAGLESPGFLDDPPLGHDDGLAWTEEDLGVTTIVSTFPGLPSGTVGLAFDARRASPHHRVLLPLVGPLLTQVGVIDGDTPVGWDEMLERLSREIGGLSASWDAQPRTGRVELAVQASGTTPDEAAAAARWLELALFHPDWRVENLPRIRSLVDEHYASLRQRTSGREEAWVMDPADAWSQQDDAVYLSTKSFLTQTWDVLRLRWMLREGDGEALLAELDDDLAGLATLMPPGADTSALAEQLAEDLARPPAEVLEQLHQLRGELLGRGGARAWAVGSDASLAPLRAALPGLASQLTDAERPPFDRPAVPVLRTAMAERGADGDARFVALVHQELQGGVHIHAAPGASWTDRDEDVLWDHLTALRYGGHGSHGVFMKTWGAGLAYSNGIRVSADQGIVGYYAERCPELPQTLEFVLDVLGEPEDSDALVDYALSQVFRGGRAADRYELRGKAMAADLADGETPEVVRGFRGALVELAGREEAASQIAARHADVYGRVMPGLGTLDDEATFFVIGSDRQLEAWAGWLDTNLDAGLERIYPSDFWIRD